MPGALRQALLATALLCAACVSVSTDVPHLAVERKLVTVALGPALLVFLSQRRSLSGALFCLCINCWAVGFLSHFLLLHKFV